MVDDRRKKRLQSEAQKMLLGGAMGGIFFWGLFEIRDKGISTIPEHAAFYITSGILATVLGAVLYYLFLLVESGSPLPRVDLAEETKQELLNELEERIEKPNFEDTNTLEDEDG